MKTLLLAIVGLACATAAQAQNTTPAAPGSGGTGAVATPNSGQLNGPGSPTGPGIGATDGAVLPNLGGNGFNNNTSLNGASSTGAPAGGPGAGTSP